MSSETKILAIIGFITMLLIVGGIVLFNRSGEPSETGEERVDQSILVREDSHQIATASASVYLVEFADLQCPACQAAHPVVKQVIAEYRDKVNYVYRHFPLSGHQNALPAAQAAEAAGEQGKFWEMQDLLYQKQTDWENADKPLEIFQTYAQSLNLDSDRFTQDFQSGKYKDLINKDKADALAAGVNATPTFFVNGKKLRGVPTAATLKKMIDQALAESSTGN